MKQLLFLSLLLTNLSFADELVLFEKPVKELPRFNHLDTKFQVDTSTSGGSIILTAIDEFQTVRCRGRGPDVSCDTEITRLKVFSHEIKVPDLNLEGDTLIFRGSSGAVECAKLGRSRVLRRPTLFLSGFCKTKATVSSKLGKKFVSVKLITQ